LNSYIDEKEEITLYADKEKENKKHKKKKKYNKFSRNCNNYST